MNTTKEINSIMYFEILSSLSDFCFIIVFPSTTIKLETAFINVSIVLRVKDNAKTITNILKTLFSDEMNNLKNDKSGFVVLSIETDTKPENPIKKIIGNMITAE